MSFSPVRAWLPPLPPTTDQAVSVPRIGGGGCSFSDDLVRPAGGERLAVRVRITDHEDGFLLDFRDSGEPGGEPAFSLGEASTITASALAFGRALDLPGPIGTARLAVLCDPDTWIGGADAADPAVVAFGMSRVFDAVTGALANAWPGRVGAGSCSLGAIVALEADGSRVVEVLPGGEGATPSRAGESAWSGPILATRTVERAPQWLVATRELRDGSGGVGARRGGEGVRRIYRVQRDVTARVAIDRLANPPHGVQRAGPPVSSRMRLQRAGTDAGVVAVRPWAPIALPAGSILTVETCGGAGHGFPGWGDIDWDG